MLLRILIGLIIAYAVLVILAWLFQDRMAFPAPSGALPDHIELQRLGAQRIDLVMKNGTQLAGLYLPPQHLVGPSDRRTVGQKTRPAGSRR